MSSTITALPAPLTPDPAAAPPLRWGILGTGVIARHMADSLHNHTRQVVAAVGSRSAERAQQFADDKGVPHAYGSYDELVADPDIDIIYVASPHSEHAAHATLALNAGKPALVEKAFARNQAEAQQIVDAAKAAGVPVMEAIMTRHTPALSIVTQLIDTGELGTIDTILADHGQNLIHVPRMVRPDLAGGALLDLGIYCVQLAVFLGGLPQQVSASGSLTDAGVDAHDAIAFSGFTKLPAALAALHTTMLSNTPIEAIIAGSEARIKLSGPFTSGSAHVRFETKDGACLDADIEGVTNQQALCYEAAHFAQLVADGGLDSPVMPAQESVAIMGLLDAVRAQVGVRYPGE